jgi:hypothetical protein
MVTPENQDRLLIPKEQPIRAGPLKINYKLFWNVLFAVIGLAGLVLSASAGVLPLGILFAGLLIAAYFLFIGIQPFEKGRTSGLSLGWRKANHAYHDLTGDTRYTSDQPEAGEAFTATARIPKRPKSIKLLGRISFLPYELPGGVLGIARDHRYNNYSATVWAAGSSLLSDDFQTQETRLAGFAGLLDQMAQVGSPVYRFAWREQTLIGEYTQPQEMVETIRRGAQLQRPNPPNSATLLSRTAEMGDSSIIHRTTMTLAVNASQIKREAKSRGGVSEVLVAQLQSFLATAQGRQVGHSPIGLKAASVLSYNDLILENRLALDPVFAQPIWEGRTWSGPENEWDLLDEQNAWPGYVNFQPADYCRLGETFHLGFYIDELTRNGMFPAQFWDILKVPVPKIVTAVFQMVPPHEAERWAQWRTTGALSFNQDRVTAHRRVTASQLKSADEALRHEVEIASNVGQVGRIRCYIDVTGSTLEEARDNALKLRNAWTGSRFIVEPLTGRQHLGINAIMPLARGLSALRK